TGPLLTNGPGRRPKRNPSAITLPHHRLHGPHEPLGVGQQVGRGTEVGDAEGLVVRPLPDAEGVLERPPHLLRYPAGRDEEVRGAAVGARVRLRALAFAEECGRGRVIRRVVGPVDGGLAIAAVEVRAGRFESAIRLLDERDLTGGHSSTASAATFRMNGRSRSVTSCSLNGWIARSTPSRRRRSRWSALVRLISA